MAEVEEFFYRLMSVLEEEYKKDPSTFAHRLSDDPQQKRHKRASPRTDLIAGIPKDRAAGLLRRALEAFQGRPFDEWSYERYGDIVAYQGPDT